MTLLFKCIGTTLLTVLLVSVLRPIKTEYALLVSLCGSFAVLYMIADELMGYLSAFLGYMADVGIESQIISVMVKAIGIGYITEFSSMTARDFGQTSLAEKIVFAGKTGIFVLTLPFIKMLCETAVAFIK
jgi:stage III sporulation protein AD